jgi:hypothetical protein
MLGNAMNVFLRHSKGFKPSQPTPTASLRFVGLASIKYASRVQDGSPSKE